jgi:hypothetical protein
MTAKRILHEGTPLRYAAIPLTLLLALALWAAVPADRSGEPHLSVRYVQNSAAETGIASPMRAVAGDYRGFDLFLLPFLCLAGVILLLAVQERPFLDPFSRAGFWAALAGVVLAAFTAWGGMSEHGNLLDHGFLALWVPPEEARGRGAFLLGVAATLGLAALAAALGGLWGREEDAHGQ